MNRFIENNMSIKMTITNFDADSVDTEEDLVRVKIKMKNDKLFKQYN
jgi:CMP-2-keto-3-deoxyoctulosonic acid synthetase